MLRLTLALLVARSSALAGVPARSAATVRSAAAVRGAAAVRSAVSMQVDWDARKEKEEREKAEAYEKLLAHLRAPIRQYEGGWADTALRDGGKDAKRFGTGPDANKGKEFEEDGEELLDDTHHASIRDVGRRKGKYSRADLTLPQEKVDKLVLPEESFKVEKMAMSQTDEDFVMECAVGEEAELTVEIEPMFLMATEYFYGFTTDSDPKISMDRDASADIEGEMAAKGHKGNVDDEERNIKIVLKFRPDSAGEFVAHLCFMFPTEKAFSKFYKITAKAGADPDATRG